MQVVGFNINKIEAEKKVKDIKNLQVRYSPNIKNAELQELGLGKKQEVLKIDFTYKVEYIDVGNISFEGHALIVDEIKEIKEFLETWKKDKSIQTPFSMKVINVILLRANIKALLLSQEINLPPPFQLPIITQNKEEDKKVNPDNYIG
ncbi:hypothetical protein CL617_05050 [archaeon]|nr:hypothetical protein [archaeon]|tara:strand:+ start:2471 stop:2914 length:444 start_codon:yes stop_codon:yes gene_type:complete